jgi:hypothetical protein
VAADAAIDRQRFLTARVAARADGASGMARRATTKAESLEARRARPAANRVGTPEPGQEPWADLQRAFLQGNSSDV